MTANNLPSPYISSASTEYDANYAAWKVFDGNGGTQWSTSIAAIPCWIKIDLGTSYIVTRYDITNGSATSYAPNDFQLEGSNTGAFGGEETVLDTQTDITWASFPLLKSYSFSNSTGYRYYRLYISTTNGGGYCDLTALELYGS
jgi:hypothetical protein